MYDEALRLMARRNFALANVVNVVLGLGLYGSVFIMPFYLTQVHGYNAMQIGQVMMWIGLPQLVMVPIVLRLMQRVDMRILLAIGAGVFGLSCLLNIHMTADYAYDHILLPHLIRGLGMPFIMIPLSVIGTAGIEPQQVASTLGVTQPAAIVPPERVLDASGCLVVPGLVDLDASVKPNKPTVDIVLPVGISFYTFQTMSYTLDVYLRRSRPARCARPSAPSSAASRSRTTSASRARPMPTACCTSTSSARCPRR